METQGRKQKSEAGGEALIAGRNAVAEALRAGREIDSIFVQRGERTGSIAPLVMRAKELGIPVKETDRRRLEQMCGGEVHQGIVAVAACVGTVDLDALFARAHERGEPPFLILADSVEDPHNLGALIRSAEGAGAHGLVIAKRRSAGLTLSVGRASAGAVEHLPVARVANLASAIEEIQKRGVWVYAVDRGGVDWCTADLGGAVALVVGGEDHGVGRLIREKCDGVLSLPMRGELNSLNASVAGAILMYEVARQRLGIRAR